MGLQCWPLPLTQHDDCDFPAGEVLLVPDVLVAILQTRPALLEGFVYFVIF